MKRRIFAWVLLAGFVLLLLNLILFRYYWQVSMIIYLVIIFGFIFSGGGMPGTREDEREPGNNGDKNDSSKGIDRD